MVPRVSFATLGLPNSVAVGFDFGHLFRTQKTLAEFFDPSLGARELENRRREFDRLRSRETHKGTLLYDNGAGALNKCYFHDYPKNTTCAATGPFKIEGVQYSSLHDYYRKRYSSLGIREDDLVAYVSFPGLPGNQAVAARLLRLRVMLDDHRMPFSLRRSTTLSPAERRRKTNEQWKGFSPAAVASVGMRVSSELWTPNRADEEQLPCPQLVFANGRTLNGPGSLSRDDYQKYFRRRLDLLKNGGLFHYDESVPRILHFVTPAATSGWSDRLQEALVRDFTACLDDISGRTFRVNCVRADGYEQISGELSAHDPTNAVIVFDDQLDDGAAYYLLSHSLSDWAIKRMTRRKVERAWRAREEAKSVDERRRAERDWRDMITHSVLKTFDRLDAVPWRIAEWPYEACLTIDVSERFRYFAVSLLVCRDHAKRPSFWRYTRSWPKANAQETINPEALRDKIANLWTEYRGPSFEPLTSLMVMRDGGERGQEGEAIVAGLEAWKKSDRLAQSAYVHRFDIHKKTVKDLRIWQRLSTGVANVLEGRAIYFGKDQALICCTGDATLSQRGTAEPCLLVGRNGADVRRGAKAFYALAQHNYTSPSKAHRYAHPLRETDANLQQRQASDMGRLR